MNSSSRLSFPEFNRNVRIDFILWTLLFLYSSQSTLKAYRSVSLWARQGPVLQQDYDRTNLEYLFSFIPWNLKKQNIRRGRRLQRWSICSRFLWVPLAVWRPTRSCRSPVHLSSDWCPQFTLGASSLAYAWQALSTPPWGVSRANDWWKGESNNTNSHTFGWENLRCNSHSTTACGRASLVA